MGCSLFSAFYGENKRRPLRERGKIEMLKRIIGSLLVLVVLVSILAGCAPAGEGPKLNGKGITAYTIVYSENEPIYNQRAAEYIQAEIAQRTGYTLEVKTAESGSYKNEIIVGETDRDLSEKLNANTENVEFAILADKKHIAMEGDYFIIAAAAYFFVETYITGKDFDSTVPREVSIHTPITEKANNFMFLIGDGMGQNHTLLFDYMEMEYMNTENDLEDRFYGYYLPYQGEVRTSSLSGTTDSAAAATALATGYKTDNGRIGRDPELNDLLSLTELANSLGMATAVMSTEGSTGATPAAFSAHADNRDDVEEILASQQIIKEAGTILFCNMDSAYQVRSHIEDVLSQLEASEKGFFLMYEEAHIDKESHNMNVDGACERMVRFNQAIATFMEYAFYHPDTFVVITADHETGGLTFDSDGWPEFTKDSHTDSRVPIFAYGEGAEVFDKFKKNNVIIPREIAKLWGVEDFGG